MIQFQCEEIVPSSSIFLAQDSCFYDHVVTVGFTASHSKTVPGPGLCCSVPYTSVLRVFIGQNWERITSDKLTKLDRTVLWDPREATEKGPEELRIPPSFVFPRTKTREYESSGSQRSSVHLRQEVF